MNKSNSAAGLLTVAFVVWSLGLPAHTGAQDPPPAPAVHSECTVDLARAGTMKDIVSNALVRGLKVPAQDVRAFLDGAQDRYANGQELLEAAAAHFKIAEDVLTAKVEKYKHCNCEHPVESALHPRLQMDPQPHPECTIDLELAGKMSDILSNALLAQRIPEQTIESFLADADEKYEDGPELFEAAAVHFEMTEDALAEEVLKFKHINCTHTGGGEADDGLPVSAFARDVTLHVVLHELGHALIREFDIPVLGNEETAADAFATYYLTTYMPDRAVDVLVARTTSLMIEAEDTPDVDWRGEHDDDARRAFQIAALAVAEDPLEYEAVAAVVGMSEEDIGRARDYGAEIRRSWRRVLRPLWMSEGVASSEARVLYDDDGFTHRLCAPPVDGTGGLAHEIEAAITRFDWHSTVTVRFVDGDGGAAWSRSGRTITVHSAYVRRFVEAGARGLPESK